MNRTIKSLTLVACVCVGMGLAPTTYAEHETGVYLQPLSEEVAARVEAGGELTRQQRGALTAAGNILKRDGKNAIGDVKQLSSASAALNRAFTDDATLTEIEENALANYIGVAETQWGEVQAGAPETGMPAAFNKLLSQAETSLTASVDTNSTFSTRARAVGQALTKLKAAATLSARTIKAPGSIEGSEVTLHQRGTDDVVISSGTYTRTGPRTATLTYTPEGGEETTVNLTFRNGTTGSFTSDAGRGTFALTEPPVITAE